MGVAVHLLFLSVVGLAVSGAPQQDVLAFNGAPQDPVYSPGDDTYFGPTSKYPSSGGAVPVSTPSSAVTQPTDNGQQHYLCSSSSPDTNADPDPASCDAYYICVQGVPQKSVCREGLHFYESKGLCDWKDKAKRNNCREKYLESVNLEESGEFALQHIASGKWLQVKHHLNDAHIIINQFNVNCKFKVERVPDTLLVHVKHVASGKYWHPLGASPYPDKGTYVVIYAKKPYYTLFTFNQDTQIIKHQSGLIVAPDQKDNRPGAWTWLQDNEINAQFRVFHYNNNTKPFLIYGNADVTAYWRLVFSFDTPASITHTQSQTVQVGHSISLSSPPPNTFAWERSDEAQYWFAEMASSEQKIGVAKEVLRSSPATWSKSTTQTVKVTVLRGKTVALWQKVFKASQLGHFSVQQSNQFAQTNSNNIKPDDFGAEVNFFQSEDTDLFVLD